MPTNKYHASPRGAHLPVQLKQTRRVLGVSWVFGQPYAVKIARITLVAFRSVFIMFGSWPNLYHVLVDSFFRRSKGKSKSHTKKPRASTGMSKTDTAADAPNCNGETVATSLAKTATKFVNAVTDCLLKGKSLRFSTTPPAASASRACAWTKDVSPCRFWRQSTKPSNSQHHPCNMCCWVHRDGRVRHHPLLGRRLSELTSFPLLKLRSELAIVQHRLVHVISVATGVAAMNTPSLMQGTIAPFQGESLTPTDATL
ncbi:hypothetical protein CAPTEDRAFT_206227 [Capitella teleta]|uniref:Uncharacterized protein n=1 Tax=Capitella teleta TaxID=283909 RepID=R7TBN6_CAPTE|nr:hypothetical protein CAPTEDRAFT_206227 [Capitella teleta]|eukprot:ELT88511.1 hypothetical protein CAPTEDRAFT_206227 [Capitella teleta]